MHGSLVVGECSNAEATDTEYRQYEHPQATRPFAGHELLEKDAADHNWQTEDALDESVCCRAEDCAGDHDSANKIGVLEGYSEIR